MSIRSRTFHNMEERRMYVTLGAIWLLVSKSDCLPDGGGFQHTRLADLSGRFTGIFGPGSPGSFSILPPINPDDGPVIDGTIAVVGGDDAPIPGSFAPIKTSLVPIHDTNVGAANSAPAAPLRWPWMALIYSHKEADCGGSLIHQCFVLTARHCTDNRNPDQLTVVLGEYKRSVAEGREQVHNVSRIYRHPTHDIAILALQSSAATNRHVQVVELSKDEPEYGSAVVGGWGQVESDRGPLTSQTADVLQYVHVPVVPRAFCNLTTTVDICAGDASSGSYTNACHGDSGGPLVQKRAGRWRQIGVVSRGPASCPAASRYAIYTNVATAYNWIKQTIPSIERQWRGKGLFGLLSAFASRSEGNDYSISAIC